MAEISTAVFPRLLLSTRLLPDFALFFFDFRFATGLDFGEMMSDDAEVDRIPTMLALNTSAMADLTNPYLSMTHQYTSNTAM